VLRPGVGGGEAAEVFERGGERPPDRKRHVQPGWHGQHGDRRAAGLGEGLERQGGVSESIGRRTGDHGRAQIAERVPETVSVPGGTLKVREANGFVRSVEIFPFQLVRKPVTNREYAEFLATGRAEAPPWWD